VRRLRGLLIALAVLAISAGAVLAGRALPQFAADGLAQGADASARPVPSAPAVVPTADDEDEAKDEGEGAAPEAEETPDADAPATEASDHPDNHGAVVSEAAKGETPEGWRNHGAYVSAVAHGLVAPDATAPPEAVANGGRMPKPDKAPKAAKAPKPTH